MQILKKYKLIYLQDRIMDVEKKKKTRGYQEEGEE